jgi:predicted N-acetyltransferase YhbS
VLIRRATDGDIEPALVVMAEAFGLPMREGPSVHTLVHSLPDGMLLVAQSDGQIVGTGGAIAFGRTGWIGGVAVAPGFRGSGLGRRLTEAALEWLGPRETVLLLASELGRPIYERLGFVAECRYRVFMTRSSSTPVGVDAADDPLAVDARATGEDRSAVLHTMPAVSAGSAVAFQPPWPALPIVGRDGSALLGLARDGMRLAVPEANEAAVDAILSMGAVERQSVTRMYRGPRLVWRPEEVWGVFSLFFG